MMDGMFSQIDFGALKEYLDTDDITDISYSNGGQLHLKTLSRGIFRVENPGIDNAFMEKLAFQCANCMGTTFNMAHPFLDAEGTELRLNFIHDSIAKNGIACVIRKTPAKIRLEKDKLLEQKYVELDIHDFLIQCVLGHCNIIVGGETGSGKTEFIKYLAAHTREDEKIITIEDTLELHLDRIFPHRDIVAMKTNNIASYTDVLVTCMRQNPKWILLSEVRSAEAVMAVRNSISSGHYILSTIHADKASSIPNRMYSLLETNQDIEQFLKSIYRYVQIGVYIRGYQDKATKKFVREIAEVTEFYVTRDNEAVYNEIYKKSTTGKVVRRKPSQYLIDYLDAQGVFLDPNIIQEGESGTPKSFDEFLKKPGVVIEPSVEDVLKETPVNETSSAPLFHGENSTVNIPKQEEKPVENKTVNQAFTFDENGTPIFNRSTDAERVNVGISKGGVLFDNHSINS
jgi:pilus assembly protein CpaF